MPKIRVGIIGTGGIAKGAHMAGYKRMLDQVELVACADIDAGRAATFAAEQGFARSYGDYDEMLRREKLDAVSICTPNKFHAPATIAALRAGAHVLCEKPPGMNAQEVDAMAQAARQTGKILTYGFHYRFRPETQAARRFADGGELGEIYSGRVTALRRRGIPTWGVFTDMELQGGGPLIDIGVHMLDSALWIMGYPEPVEVMGATYQKIGTQAPGPAPWGPWDHKSFAIEDMANAMIRFDTGATLLLETSFAANIEPMEEFNVRLQGTLGGLTLFPFKVHKEVRETLVDMTPAWLPKAEPHSHEIANFIAAVKGEAEPVSTPEEGNKLQRLIDAIYGSAEAGHAVRV